MENKRAPRTYEFEAKPNVLIVEARFYDDLADMQLRGAQAVLDVRDQGVGF
jgi:6,7-dimethyl-8-ribityllumazine synthase